MRFQVPNLAFGSDVILPEVAPQPSSHFDHQRRFGGLARLYGKTGADQIFASHVVVIGIGGVGSWVAEALARSGVARITLIDMDHVSESNINRQIQANDYSLGQSKIQAMQARIHSYHPGCLVEMIDEFVTPENWINHLVHIEALAPVDAVIDACDQVKTKIALAAWSLSLPKAQAQTLFITAGAAGGKQLAHQVQIADLSTATHDPLLAKMRYTLRRAHGGVRLGAMKVACVFSQEPVLQPAQTASQGEEGAQCAVVDANLNCHGYGSVVSVTATFGMCAAGWVLSQLSKKRP